MRNYSNKQELYAKYMLNKFGIDDQDFISKFLQYYAKVYGEYVQYGNRTYFKCTECINQLVIEKNLRHDRHLIKVKDMPKQHINATDLSNYTFCPASFAISDTFEIEFPTGEEEREIGVKLHNKLKLIQRISDYKATGKIAHRLFEDPIILEILKSENVYAGHQDERKTFYNSDLNVACEPDYIFKDNYSNYFAVEEKFQYKPDPSKTTNFDNYLDETGICIEEYEEYRQNEISEWNDSKVYFYPNHQIQLITYLKSIEEYDLKYGYLVYWFYSYNENREPYIHKTGTKKITLADWSLNLFDTVYQGINQLLANKSSTFETEKINPNKCAGCVVNKYCGHKNKKIENLSFPYKKEYLRFYKADFPDELKKTNEKETTYNNQETI